MHKNKEELSLNNFNEIQFIKTFKKDLKILKK